MSKTSFLPSLSANRPITVTVSLLAILVVGYIAYQQVPLEMFPSGFTEPDLGVWVPYPNANPQEVEEQIARPIEEEVRTIPGIKTVRSWSGSDGCWVGMQFASGTDMDVAYDQLRDRMERVRAIIPSDIERYWLRKDNNQDIPVVFLSITLPDHIDDPYYVVDHFVKRPIERIDGVANVQIWGADEKSIQILVNQDKVKAHRVNLFEVITNLQNDNFSQSSGWVYEGGKKFVVRSVARFQSIDAIKNLPINNLGLTVGDVADVKYDIQKRTWHERVNGKPSLLIGIFKESLANTVALSDNLEKILQEDINKVPILKDAEVNIFVSQGRFIKNSIDNLQDTAFWGGAFAIIILLLFLRNFRMTSIMMFAIPLSILISLMVLYFTGKTLNIFTMMGLMISVGMVVDNGIVVLENIYHKRNDGLSQKDASIFGASEMNLALILATLTTVIALLVPILLINDDSGGFKFFMSQIGLPVVYALAASLVVALVLIPLATTRLSVGKLPKESRFIRAGKRYYERLLKVALKRRMDTVLAVILFVVFTAISFQLSPRSDDQGGGISDVRLIFELPDNFTEEEASEYFAMVEDTIATHQERYNIRTYELGFHRTFGRFRIYLEASKNTQWYHAAYEGIISFLGIESSRPMKREEVLADIKERIPVKPGVEFRTSWRGNSDGADGGSVSILLYGDDTGKLVQLSEEVERRMRLIDGVVSVETDREKGNDEIKIQMDREVVSRNGLNPNQIAFSLMYAVRGLNLPRFQAQDKEIQVRVQLQEEDRENLSQLKNITFINNQGRAIPLSAVASFGIEKGFGQIRRMNGKTYLEVKANTTSEDLQGISKQVDAIMENFPMPVGYDWQKGSRFIRFDDQLQGGMEAMWIAILFVYLVMAVLFESLLLPLSVMLTIPLAFFGAFLMLNITQTAVGITALIGIVILIGVVVNNGIILVDMINRKRMEGLSRTEAILEAGKHRFRPIMMTSFTTIGGLIPMALGQAELWVGIPYAPMGRAIIGGLLSATFLTLIVVPVFYTLFDEFGIFLGRIVTWLRGKKASGDVALSPES